MIATYADIWRPQQQPATYIYDAVLVLAGSLLIALSAQVSFNIGPVPITGQTFGVLLVAALLGWKRGTLAVIAYLIEGISGFPVFAGGTSSLAVIFGPSGGYLIGFIPAATLVGWLAEQGWDRNFVMTVLAMIAGNIIIYAYGVPYLKTILGVDWSTAFAYGLTPFVLGDLVKVIAAAIVLPAGWKLLNK